jgi:[ribosomal protein S5]-alanine N-acetyltransferase
VWRFLGVEPFDSIEQTHERIQRLMRFEREHGFTLWPIVECSSGIVIGDCGLIPLERVGPEIELGYRLGSGHWGKGYATEAALAVRDLGFERFGLERIYVDVDPGNDGSLNVARKLGARLLGPATHMGDPVQRFVLERG